MKRPDHHAARRGTALVAVFALSVALAGVAMSVCSSALARAKEGKIREDDLLLFSTADSAMSLLFSHYYDNLAQLPSSTSWTDVVPTRGGVPVTTLNGIAVYCQARCITASKVWQLRVEAKSGSQANPETYRRTMVQASVVATNAFMAGLAGMYSVATYTFKGSGNAGWFDSNPGVSGPNKTAYENQPNGPWVLGSPNGVTVAKPGNVNGSYGYLTIPPPNLMWNPTPATASSALTADVTLAPGNYHYTAWTSGIITIPSDGTVTLYVDGDIDYGSIGVKYSTSGSKLKVWQTNPTFAHADGNSSKLNGNNFLGDIAHPDRFTIFSITDGTITLNGNAQMGAVLIAPNASLMLRGTFDFYGAIFVAGMTSSTTTGNPTFMYDVNLADTTFPELQSIGWNAWWTAPLGYSGVATDPAAHRFGDLSEALDP